MVAKEMALKSGSDYKEITKEMTDRAREARIKSCWDAKAAGSKKRPEVWKRCFGSPPLSKRQRKRAKREKAKERKNKLDRKKTKPTNNGGGLTKAQNEEKK